MLPMLLTRIGPGPLPAAVGGGVAKHLAFEGRVSRRDGEIVDGEKAIVRASPRPSAGTLCRPSGIHASLTCPEGLTKL